MTIGDHLHAFHGLPAFTFPGPEAKAELPAPDSVAWRITSDTYDADEKWVTAFARFLDAVDTTGVRALVVGAWEEAYEDGPSAVVEALVAARDRLPALRALFLGDMVMEECEISWINQTDVTPLLTAFPALEELGVRGGTELRFPAVRHDALRRLTMEAAVCPSTSYGASAPATCPPSNTSTCGSAPRTTAATARRPTWSRSCPAPACRACATWPCATARCRTPSPPPWPPRPWSPGWRRWTCRWAS